MPICHQVVEIMFASMFRLPDAPMIDIAYATIFIELCKLQPQNMPQALALATELLFERMDTMGKTATDRCINWFGHHLSNFQFRWQWDEWADCITQGQCTLVFDKQGQFWKISPIFTVDVTFCQITRLSKKVNFL